MLQLSPTRRKRLISFGRLYDQLDNYQKDAVQFARSVKTAALLFEQGTGKTWICGGFIESILDEDFSGLLIVGLSNIDSTWVEFLTKQLPQLNVYRDWVSFKAGDFPKLLLLHYEAVPRDIKKIRKFKFTFICYDESQRIKDRTSLASRTAAKLRFSSVYSMILSGTPIDEQPMDLWAQLRFLNPDILGERWKDFEDEFVEPYKGPDPKKHRPGSHRWRRAIMKQRILNRKRKFDFDKLPQFLERISPYCMRVTKSVLNLPEMFVHQVPVELRGRQRRLYDEVQTQLITSLGEGRQIVARFKVTQILHLHRICGGYIKDEEGEIHEVGRAKIRATLKLIDKLDKPIVIFCRYLEEVWSLHDEIVDLDLRVKTLTGMRGSRKKKAAIRLALVKEFQAGKIDVLVCQIKAGGVGIDLFRSCNAILYSYWHSFIDYDQALSRLHRRGQEFNVNIFLIYAISTVDEDIFSALTSKRKITELVLSRLTPKGKKQWQRKLP